MAQNMSDKRTDIYMYIYMKTLRSRFEGMPFGTKRKLRVG
jgi:hypothetical protein